MGWWGEGTMQGDTPLDIVCEFKDVIPNFYGPPLTLDFIKKQIDELYKLLINCKDNNEGNNYDVAVSFIIKKHRELVDTKVKNPSEFTGKSFIEIWGEQISLLICKDYNLDKVEDINIKYYYPIFSKVQDNIKKILRIGDALRDITCEELIKYNDKLMDLVNKYDGYYAIVLAHVIMKANAPMSQELKELVVKGVQNDDIIGRGWTNPQKRKEAMEQFQTAVLEYDFNNNERKSYPNAGLFSTILTGSSE